MKIYLFPKGFTMIGKAWEIQVKLREYSKQYKTVQEWITEPKKKNSNR